MPCAGDIGNFTRQGDTGVSTTEKVSPSLAFSAGRLTPSRMLAGPEALAFESCIARKMEAIQEFLPQRFCSVESKSSRAASQLPMCSWGPAAHFRILYRATEMWLIQEFLRQDLGAVASKSRRPPRAFPHACGSRGVRFRVLYRATEI